MFLMKAIDTKAHAMKEKIPIASRSENPAAIISMHRWKNTPNITPDFFKESVLPLL